MSGGLRVIVEADGGARGNPGPAGYGAVVLAAGTGELLAERLGALGVATNNVAEYQGLIAGLQAAADLGADEVEVRMDSKLVVEQMSGRWQIKHPGLRPLAAQAAALLRGFSAVRFTWVPRERNQRADALANAAMDGKTAVERADPAAGPAPAADAGSTAAADPVQVAPVPWQPGTPTARAAWEPPATAATRLLLVRHGATELTAQRRYSGRGDVALSARGRAQAEAVARRVVALGAPLGGVVSSPLSRCLETARLIASAAGGVPLHTDPDLIECDFGAWEGLTFAEVRRRFPDEVSAWLASPAIAPPGGESFDSVRARVRAALSRLLQGYPEQVIVVVSHVSPLKLVLRDALGAGDAFLHRCYLDPAGLSIVDSWPDGVVAVRSVNDTAHLAELR